MLSRGAWLRVASSSSSGSARVNGCMISPGKPLLKKSDSVFTPLYRRRAFTCSHLVAPLGSLLLWATSAKTDETISVKHRRVSSAHRYISCSSRETTCSCRHSRMDITASTHIHRGWFMSWFSYMRITMPRLRFGEDATVLLRTLSGAHLTALAAPIALVLPLAYGVAPRSNADSTLIAYCLAASLVSCGNTALMGLVPLRLRLSFSSVKLCAAAWFTSCAWFICLSLPSCLPAWVRFFVLPLSPRLFSRLCLYAYACSTLHYGFLHAQLLCSCLAWFRPGLRISYQPRQWRNSASCVQRSSHSRSPLHALLSGFRSPFPGFLLDLLLGSFSLFN